MKDKMESPIYSVDDLARMLSICNATVYKLIAQHELPAHKVGRRYVVTAHAFEAWLQSKRMPLGT